MATPEVVVVVVVAEYAADAAAEAADEAAAAAAPVRLQAKGYDLRQEKNMKNYTRNCVIRVINLVFKVRAMYHEGFPVVICGSNQYIATIHRLTHVHCRCSRQRRQQRRC